MLQFPPAEWRLLHQHSVCQHIESGFHNGQHVMHG